MADSVACECGEPEQTADHIINSCPLHRPPSEAGLFEVGPLTRAWLQQAELTISYDDTRKKKRTTTGWISAIWSKHRRGVQIEDKDGNLLAESNEVLEHWMEYGKGLYKYFCELNPDVSVFRSGAAGAPILR